MAKLKLVANPTFKAMVKIPVAGSEPVSVEFSFKHRTRKDFNEWLKKERVDSDAIMEMAEGWDLEESFNKENVELMVQNYMGSATAVFDVYFDELTKARSKN